MQNQMQHITGFLESSGLYAGAYKKFVPFFWTHFSSWQDVVTYYREIKHWCAALGTEKPYQNWKENVEGGTYPTTVCPPDNSALAGCIILI